MLPKACGCSTQGTVHAYSEASSWACLHALARACIKESLRADAQALVPIYRYTDGAAGKWHCNLHCPCCMHHIITVAPVRHILHCARLCMPVHMQAAYQNIVFEELSFFGQNLCTLQASCTCCAVLTAKG